MAADPAQLEPTLDLRQVVGPASTITFWRILPTLYELHETDKQVSRIVAAG